MSPIVAIGALAIIVIVLFTGLCVMHREAHQALQRGEL